MYRMLANVVVGIHIIVIIFMLGGYFFPKKWKRMRTFHRFFGVTVFVSQILYGLRCPLVVLEQKLRQLDNPSYEMQWTPFTQRLFKTFGIYISRDVILCVISLIAVVGVTELLTIAATKEGGD